MSERQLTSDYMIRGEEYEIWREDGDWYIVNPRTRTVIVDTDFTPPLTQVEIQKIADYVWDSESDNYDIDRP